MKNLFWAALLSFFIVALAFDEDVEDEVEPKIDLEVSMLQNIFLK
jgi:hypothetical protein